MPLSVTPVQTEKISSLRNNPTPKVTVNPKTLLSVLSLTVVMIAAAVSQPEPRSTQRQKARYYYMEGVRHSAAGENAEAYEYFRKAYQADPTYEEAANSFGAKRLIIKIDTLQSRAEVKRSFSLMGALIDRYPGDIFESSLYAYVAANTDSLEEAVRVFKRTVDLNPGKTALLVHLADSYMATGQVDSALNALNTYERLEGKSTQLTIKKLNYLMAVNDTTGAIREVNSLIESSPTIPDYLMLKGNLFEALALPDSALTYYRRAEQLEPDNGAIKMTLAGFYKDRGDSVAYDSAIYDALLSEDFELEDKLQILSEYLQTLIRDNSDTQRGDYLFSALERQHPHEPAVLDLAARYSAAKGDWREAIEHISYAIDLNPTEETYRGQLITYYLSDEQPKAAMKAYEAALSHIEQPAEGMQLLYASACSMAGYHDKARVIYIDRIKAVMPQAYSDSTIEDSGLRHRLDYDGLIRVSTLYNMLGDSYYTSGEKDKAFVAYDNSLYFMPDNPMTLNNYAYFLTEEGGDLEQASVMSRSALDQSPDNDTYIDTYAWIEFKLGHFEEARLYQKKAIEIAEARDSASAELYEHYGDILFMCQEPEEAVMYWEKALELEPDNALLKKKVEHRTYFYPESHKK